MARYRPKEGYVQLWRRLRDHRFWPTFKRRKFTKLEAWIDLLFDSTYKAHTMKFRGQVFHLKPGELVFSQDDRADRWRWSRGKVRGFLNDLYLNGEASHEELQGITRVTIHRLTGCAEWQPDSRRAVDGTGKKGGRREGKEGNFNTPFLDKVQVLVQGVADKLDSERRKG